MLCNMSLSSWPIMFVNEKWENLLGIERNAALDSSFWDLFQVGADLGMVRLARHSFSLFRLWHLPVRCVTCLNHHALRQRCALTLNGRLTA